MRRSACVMRVQAFFNVLRFLTQAALLIYCNGEELLATAELSSLKTVETRVLSLLEVGIRKSGRGCTLFPAIAGNPSDRLMTVRLTCSVAFKSSETTMPSRGIAL